MTWCGQYRNAGDIVRIKQDNQQIQTVKNKTKQNTNLTNVNIHDKKL